MRNKRLAHLTHAAVIASLYVVFTYIAAILGMASGAIQVRLSEALCVLPIFTPAAVPGLFIGCLAANLLTGCALWDVVFGSLATLIGAVLCRMMSRNRQPGKVTPLCLLPNIISNTVIVPLVLMYVYATPETFWYLALTVGIGEVISCGVLGFLLGKTLAPHEERLFGKNSR